MDNNDINESNDFGALEFDLEDIATETSTEDTSTEDTSQSQENKEETTEETTSTETSETTTEETTEENTTSNEDSPDDVLTDEAIVKEYGEEVSPALVRHYNEVKDLLMVDEDFKFDGTNIDEAYAQDDLNRSVAVANHLVNQLPENYKIVLEHALKNEGDLTPETLDILLENSKKRMENTFDEEDPDSMRAYVKARLVAEGEDPEIAEERIDLYEDRGKLKGIAQTIKKKEDDALVAEAEAKKLKDKQAEDKRRKDSKVIFDGVTSTLQSSTMSKKKQGELAKFIFGKNEKTNKTPLVSQLNQIWKDPEALVFLADLVAGYNPEKKTWDVGRIEDRVESKATNKLKSAIEQRLSGSTAFTQKNQGNKDSVSWDDVDI